MTRKGTTRRVRGCGTKLVAEAMSGIRSSDGGSSWKEAMMSSRLGS